MASTGDNSGRRDLGAEGWTAIDGGTFGDFVGPFWRRVVDGRSQYGFVADERHANHRNIVHGGMIMTFADYVVGMAGAELAADIHQVTIQLDVQFVSAAEIGELLVGHSEVLRATSSLVFLRGTIEANGRVVATGTGIWKRVRPLELARSSRDAGEGTK